MSTTMCCGCGYLDVLFAYFNIILTRYSLPPFTSAIPCNSISAVSCGEDSDECYLTYYHCDGVRNCKNGFDEICKQVLLLVESVVVTV